MMAGRWALHDGYLVSSENDDAHDVSLAEVEVGLPEGTLFDTPPPSLHVVPFEDTPPALTPFLWCQTDEDFLAFIKRYGHLGVTSTLPHPLEVDGRDVEHAESLTSWWDAHRVLGVALRTWEAAKGRKIKALGELLQADTPGHLALRVHCDELTIGGVRGFSYEQRFSTPGRPGPPDLVAFGGQASARLVNALLRDHAAPQASLPTGADRAALRISASGLLGGMAGEILLSMTGIRRYVTCPGCGRLNDATDAPATRLYCSGDRGVNCRKRASRERLRHEQRRL